MFLGKNFVAEPPSEIDQVSSIDGASFGS